MAIKPIRCKYCGGNGKVTVWDPVKKTYVLKPCPACGGSGIVYLP